VPHLSERASIRTSPPAARAEVVQRDVFVFGVIGLGHLRHGAGLVDYGDPYVPLARPGDDDPEVAAVGVLGRRSEPAVREAYRTQGIADLLSRALLEDREEDLAVLLVDVAHPRVQALYEDWGFKKVGEQQPFPDSPVFAVMLAKLPLKS
jgi:ribosomal protein S18 acetylase RimI-like enzyme